ncbi:MAG: restriction endonuclease subunit S [Holophagaceae bacterium]|nr:restriction endonuclease subunit S [Holophagaceae bacterium]
MKVADPQGPAKMRTEPVPLGNLVTFTPRFVKGELPENSLASFIPMKCVEEESGRFESIEDRKVSEVQKGYTAFRDGDVIFAKVTPCMENGKAAVLKGLTNGIGFGSTEFFVLRPKASLNPRYLLHFLLQKEFRSRAAQNMTGAVGLRRVPKSYLEQQLIPLPSLPEQKRIVAEIEKQFTRLDAGVAALRRIQANLKRYRAAVLKAACEGRLVPTEAELARTENRDLSFETGEALLSRILVERKSKWEKDQLLRFRGNDRVPKNDKWRSRYPEPSTRNASSLPPLPVGWTWVELGQLTWSVKDGPHYSPNYVTEGIPFISGGNIRPSGVDFSNAKRISPELHAELSQRCKPEVGDILYTKGGTTGIARVNIFRRIQCMGSRGRAETCRLGRSFLHSAHTQFSCLLCPGTKYDTWCRQSRFGSYSHDPYLLRPPTSRRTNPDCG